MNGVIGPDKTGFAIALGLTAIWGYLVVSKVLSIKKRLTKKPKGKKRG